MKQHIIGRVEELSVIVDKLQEVSEGAGQTFGVSGEAGIGKTAFLNEVAKNSEGKGFRTLSGRCSHKGIPFESFFQLLSGYPRETILGEENFVSIDTIFLISKSGLLVHHVSNTESKMDEDILSGMLTAVQNFVGDSFGDESNAGGLGRLEYKNTKILIEHGEFLYIAAIITADEHEDMIKHLASVLIDIERDFKDELTNWSGNMSELEGIEPILPPLTERKYRIQKDITTLDVNREKLKIFDRVTNVLNQEANEVPLFLSLEDMHLADELSLQALQYLSRNIRGSKILLTFTYRTEEVSGQLENILNDMRQDEIMTDIYLSKLSKDEIRMLANRDMGLSLSDNVLDESYSVTRGNPLYVKEYFQKIKDDSKTPFDEITELPPISQTASLVTLMSERLLALDENELYLAERLATIGEEFDENLISHCFEENENAMSLNGIDKLVSMRILEKGEPDEFRFQNSIIHRVLYEGQGARWRALHHLRVGNALEVIHHDSLDEVIYELANHFLETNDARKATDFADQAGRKAQEVYANEDALSYYQRALEVTERYGGVSKAKQAELSERAGDMMILLGQHAEAEEILETSSKLYVKNEDISRAQWKIGNTWLRRGDHKKAIDQADKILEMDLDSIGEVLPRVYDLRGMAKSNIGDYKDAIEDLREAENISHVRKDIAEEAHTLGRLGVIYQNLRDWDAARDYFNRGLVISSNINDLQQLTVGYNGLGVINKEEGNFDDSIKYFLKCREIVEKTGDVYGLGALYLNIATAYRRMGKWDEAIKSTEAGIEIQKRIGNKQGQANAYNNLGIIYDERGDWTMALDLHLRSLGIKEDIGDKFGQATSNNELGWITRKLGDISKAENHFKRCIEILEEIENITAKTYPLGALGDLYFDTDRIEQAKKCYEEGFKIAKETGQTYELGAAHGRLAIAKVKEDLEGAEEHLRQAIEIANEINDPYMTAEVKRDEGIVKREKGEMEVSITTLTSSIKIFEELNSPFEIGKTKYELALAHSKDGDGEKAGEHFTEALEIFEKLGAKLEIEKTSAQISNK